jgi:hypothetical protein
MSVELAAMIVVVVVDLVAAAFSNVFVECLYQLIALTVQHTDHEPKKNHEIKIKNSTKSYFNIIMTSTIKP